MKKIASHLKDNWIQYGFETIVVAVGILAAFGLNNWKEQSSEARTELVYIENLLEDLKADTSAFADYEKINLELFNIIDSLVVNISNPNRKKYTSKSSYWARILTSKWRFMIPVDRTYEQMKSSGQLKLIKNQKVANEIAKYYHSTYILEGTHDVGILEMDNYFKAMAKVFDGELLLRIFKERKPQKTDSSAIITEDEADINELITTAQYLYGAAKLSEEICRKRNEAAINLIQMIQSNYQISKEKRK